MLCDNNCQFIDLGLSVRWASCNLGASHPQEHGVFYALALSSELIQRGLPVNVLDNSLGLEHAWHKPTRENFEELFLCCDLYWNEYLGATGLTAVSRVYPNHYIFLPTAGWRDLDGTIHDEDICCYWTGESYQYDNHFAWGYRFDEKEKRCAHRYIGLGLCIRPVIERQA